MPSPPSNPKAPGDWRDPWRRAATTATGRAPRLRDTEGAEPPSWRPPSGPRDSGELSLPAILKRVDARYSIGAHEVAHAAASPSDLAADLAELGFDPSDPAAQAAAQLVEDAFIQGRSRGRARRLGLPEPPFERLVSKPPEPYARTIRERPERIRKLLNPEGREPSVEERLEAAAEYATARFGAMAAAPIQNRDLASREWVVLPNGREPLDLPRLAELPKLPSGADRSAKHFHQQTYPKVCRELAEAIKGSALEAVATQTGLCNGMEAVHARLSLPEGPSGIPHRVPGGLIAPAEGGIFQIIRYAASGVPRSHPVMGEWRRQTIDLIARFIRASAALPEPEPAESDTKGKPSEDTSPPPETAFDDPKPGWWPDYRTRPFHRWIGERSSRAARPPERASLGGRFRRPDAIYRDPRVAWRRPVEDAPEPLGEGIGAALFDCSGSVNWDPEVLAEAIEAAGGFGHVSLYSGRYVDGRGPLGTLDILAERGFRVTDPEAITLAASDSFGYPVSISPELLARLPADRELWAFPRGHGNVIDVPALRRAAQGAGEGLKLWVSDGFACIDLGTRPTAATQREAAETAKALGFVRVEPGDFALWARGVCPLRSAEGRTLAPARKVRKW